MRVSVQDQTRNKSAQEVQDQTRNKMEVRKLFSDVVNSKTASHKTKKIKKLKDKLSETYSEVKNLDFGSRQEDATEFLRPLLENLYEENPLTEASQLSPADDVTNKSQYEVKEPRKDNIFTTEIPISASRLSLRGFLDEYQGEETLDASENALFDKISGGSEKIKTKKKISLSVDPKAKEIVFTLRRFERDLYGNQNKINKDVELDNITLPYSKGVNKGVNTEWTPTSFIVHMGEDTRSGHYVTCALEFDENNNKQQWYLYNDSEKLKIGDSDLAYYKAQAYAVKYSLIENGKITLPQSSSQESGARNKSGTTCWANSTAAFLGSFVSFQSEEIKAKEELNRLEKKKEKAGEKLKVSRKKKEDEDKQKEKEEEKELKKAEKKKQDALSVALSETAKIAAEEEYKKELEEINKKKIEDEKNKELLEKEIKEEEEELQKQKIKLKEKEEEIIERQKNETAEEALDRKVKEFLDQTDKIHLDKRDLIENYAFEIFKDAAELYSPGEVEVLKNKMVGSLADFLKNANSVAVEQWLHTLKNEILPERRQALRQYINVRRQKQEIEKYELKPGEVNVGALAEQISNQIPLNNKEKRFWQEEFGYGDDTGNNWSSFFGGTRKAIDVVKNRDTPIIHTTMPSKRYRNIVFDTEVEVRDQIVVNDLKLDKWLNEGKKTTAAEEDALKERIWWKHRRDNLFESLLDNSLKLFNWAGKGITSKSKVSEDSRYQAYLQKRNGLLSSMILQLNPKNSSAYLEVLKRVNDILANSTDLLDQATFNKLTKLIEDEIVKENAASKAELERFNVQIQKLNEAMLSTMEGHVKTEDEMWKYRVMQMFLILTPIGAFSVAGHVFSYMDPLTQLLGPLFDGDLAGGIASITSSPVLGPFGIIADKMQIDKAVEVILDKTPILSQFCDTFNFVTGNYEAQQLFGTVSPLSSSVLFPLGIAGAVSMFRADTEITHWDKVNKDVEAKNKDLKNAVENFDKTSLKNKNERISKFTDAKMEILKQGNQKVKLAEFIHDNLNEDGILDLFEDVKFNGQTLKSFPKESTEKDILDFIKKIEGTKELAELFRRFYLFLEAGEEVDELIKNGNLGDHLDDDEVDKAKIEEFNKLKNSSKAAKIIDQRKKNIDNEFIGELAKKNSIISEDRVDDIMNRKDVDAEMKKLEEEIKKKENIELQTLGDTPNTVISKASAHSLIGQNNLYNNVVSVA